MITGKKRRFAKVYAKTLNGTQAAMQVYNTNSPDTASVLATRNLKDPEVQAIVKQEMDTLGYDEKTIITEIGQIGLAKVETKITADQKLRALDKLAILRDMYPAKKTIKASFSYSEHYDNLPVHELVKELKELRALNKELNSL